MTWLVVKLSRNRHRNINRGLYGPPRIGCRKGARTERSQSGRHKVKTKIHSAIAAIALASAALAGAAHAEAIVKIDGSSTVYPITEAMAEEFQKANADIKVTVGISGTGGGFKKFCAGGTDISDASRPITSREAAACKANGIEVIELPIELDALAVTDNPQNDWV